MTEDWFDQISGSCTHTTAAFAVWCTIPTEWQATGRYCEVWVSFGGVGQDNLPQDIAWFKENGEKIPAANLCYSWWYPTAVELNVRVFGTGINDSTAPWVGGSYAQMIDPSGVNVLLVETSHGYPDTPNWGTPTDGIPWCK
ncbi:MAG: hypothetical protein A2294_03280 [Candidatus Magasanikbacteria bacterium RIFOXYB2_FULL_38_10]|nr:MAG: hypothetical protein A2294_03280 [Candidatus Magasanikbacteria bacterium RIFOXYB2_FULL_38_10]